MPVVYPFEATKFRGPRFIKEIQITNDGPVSFPIFRDPLQGGVMTITICWTDPPGTPPTDALDPTALMLVNDLDLRVIAPDGTTVFYPRRLRSFGGVLPGGPIGLMRTRPFK